MSPPPEPPPPELPPDAPLVPAEVAALAAGVMVTCVDPERAVSAADTAVTVTVAGVGTAVGAVYMPVLEIVPRVVLPPATPFTSHVTVVLAEFMTVAEKASAADTGTFALVGLTATVIIGVTATWAEALLVVSALDTAVTVTVAGDGTVDGAV